MKKFIAFIILLFSINAFAQFAPMMGIAISSQFMDNYPIVEIKADADNFYAKLLTGNRPGFTVKKYLKDKLIDPYPNITIAQDWTTALDNPNVSYLALSMNGIETHLIVIGLYEKDGIFDISIVRTISLSDE